MKEVLWDAKRQKFAGNTDYGPILAEDQDTIAHNALVVMAVGLQKSWSQLKQHSFYVPFLAFPLA